jgi:DNA repair protein RadD
MATGGGKTECFIELVRRANVRTAVLVGRMKLVSQTVTRMSKVIDNVGVWSAAHGEKRISGTTVVSIHSADTLTIDGLKLIICDEAHNLNDGRYARFIARHPEAKLVGFTATPWRDGVEIFGEGQTFPRVHYRRGLKDLIRDRFLVPPVVKQGASSFKTEGLKVQGDDFKLSEIIRLTEDSGKIKAQVADALPRLHGRLKVVWMCASIEHAEKVAKAIGNAAIIHSKNPHNDYAIECFERGDVPHMVSVMMLSEGYDYPPVDAIVLMRPTRSPTLYVQAVGRGLRPSGGKKDCLVLDYGEVVKHCGPLHDPLTRARRMKADKEKMVVTVRVCPKCLSYVHGDVCEDCGHEMKIERDVTKNLTRTASMVDLLKDRRPEIIPCVSVSAGKYKSKKGNDCIMIEFRLKDRMMPVRSYISSHPFSWQKGQGLIYKLTPFRFESWQECFDACETIPLEVPDSVIVGEENGFAKIEGILSRAPDSDIPF